MFNHIILAILIIFYDLTMYSTFNIAILSYMSYFIICILSASECIKIII